MSKVKINAAGPTTDIQVIITNGSRVACNGGGGPLGHPKVWLSLSGNGQVKCPYCSRHFAAATPQPQEL